MSGGRVGVGFRGEGEAAVLPTGGASEGLLGTVAIAAGGVDLEVAARLVDIENFGEHGEGCDAGAAGGLEACILAGSVGVMGVVAWTCVGAKGQETEDGMRLRCHLEVSCTLFNGEMGIPKLM